MLENKRLGFTLVELLAVIVILVIILAISVPGISNIIDGVKLSSYNKNEQIMIRATINYIGVNDSNLPVYVGDSRTVELIELQNNNFISDIKDVKNSTITCDGYTLVTKVDNTNYTYAPYLKCGSNYKTEGYIDEGLSSVEVLVVAGGGGGGYRHGSGGGAGGLIFNSSYTVTGSTKTIVGNGGLGSIGSTIKPANGQNSTFGALVAIGGGGAGQFDGGYGNGTIGGSGGGSVNLSSAAGTVNQGNNGGTGATNALSPYNHGGGGGAGAPGGNGTLDSHGSGGIGLYFGDKFGDIVGENGYFAGGGGGGGHNPQATYRGFGGLGGGGNGGTPGIIENGENGISNTGGGGGGASTSSGGTGRGGNGGSGIIIVRYLGSQKAYGGIVSSLNGYTIHTFTSGTACFIVR